MNNAKYHCHLCGSAECSLLHRGTRDNPNVDVIKCSCCSFVFLSSFEHIEDGYYEESKMNADMSVEKWIESTAIDDQRRCDQFKELINGRRIIDFGCGNGGFLRKANKWGKSVVGVELDSSARDYIEKNDYISVYDSIDKCNGRFDCVFLFHVIEHLRPPLGAFFDSIFNKLESNGEIIIETPNADDALLTFYSCEAFANFTYWSPHICLYNLRTLSDMLDKSGCRINWIHQYQRYSLANHLKWLYKGLPGGGINEYEFLNRQELNDVYSKTLSELDLCDTLICSVGKKC